MKFTNSVVATLAVLGGVSAQALDGLPPCGQTCISNLLGSAGDFGCTGADAACLCRNASFSYGIRDCSNESCPDAASAAAVISYGISYCATAGIAIPTDFATVTGSAPTSTDNGAGGATPIPVTTSSYVATVTNTDGSLVTTTAATTLYSSGPAETPTSAPSAPTSTASSATGAVSSVVASASSAVSSATSSAKPTPTGSGTSTSSAFAAQMTAAPVGFLAAAGIAVMLL